MQNIRGSMSEKATTKRRLIIVDDHPILRSGLVQLINREPDLVIVKEASDAKEALQMIEADHMDMALVDISLQAVSGIDLTKSIRQMRPTMPILILSMHDETFYAERALRVGANGYIMKTEPPAVLLKAIREVFEGEVFVSEKIASRLLRGFLQKRQPQRNVAPRTIEALSDREMGVFEGIGRGHSMRDIAAQMGRSVKTMETHRGNIVRKLGLTSGAELSQYAARWMSTEGDEAEVPGHLAAPPAGPAQKQQPSQHS
jgi:DNA-binding NarL/FixJ family response regulator